ncbi:MAG: hypothetical protein K8Q99_02570 [Acholeplasmataceae bacterium]|nr:hypothetical protein [Acholeplasmataceae bacterium]
MKQKQIKKILRQEIDNRIPERLDTSSFGLIKHDKPIKNTSFSFNKRLGLSFASFVLIAIVVTAFALRPSREVINRQPYAFSAENQVVSFSAMSTSSILSHLESDALLASDQIVLLSSQTSQTPIDPIVPYLEMAERFITIGDGFNITEIESDLAEYTNKSIFKTITLTHSAITYTMYYNITSSTIENDEENYQMEGILIYGQKTYQIQGSKEIEDDEEIIEFKSLIDDDNYVESKYEIDKDETKFSFKTVVNSITVEESVVEIEKENDKIEIKLEFINGVDRRVYEFTYEEKNEQAILSINYETIIKGIEKDGEIEVYIITDPLTNNTIYKLILDDEEYEVDRDEEDEDDEDEDEDDEDVDEEDEDEEDDPIEENEDDL